jgi:hypothetical protein
MDEDVIQVVMLSVMRPAFEKWLADRGCLLFRMPDHEDDLPTYGISPTDALLARYP